jgi:hypothetical protein
MIRSGGRSRDDSQRRVAGPDDLGLRVAASLERVLDETGDVALVFHDEDAMSGHSAAWSVSAADVVAVSKLLIVG